MRPGSTTTDSTSSVGREHGRSRMGTLRPATLHRSLTPPRTMPDEQRIYLVRHAKAGDRDRWEGDDVTRPLTPKGRIQAEQLADTFAALPPSRLLSSPYVRCLETLEPTARRTAVAVEPVEALREGRPWEDALELLHAVPANAVLCSHGDLIPALIEALERRGTAITTAPDWRKASMWVLTRAAHGAIVRAAAVAPPGS